MRWYNGRSTHLSLPLPLFLFNFIKCSLHFPAARLKSKIREGERVCVCVREKKTQCVLPAPRASSGGSLSYSWFEWKLVWSCVIMYTPQYSLTAFFSDQSFQLRKPGEKSPTQSKSQITNKNLVNTQIEPKSQRCSKWIIENGFGSWLLYMQYQAQVLQRFYWSNFEFN